MNYYTLSITSYGHDASIALFDHDQLIYFILSERITREKNTKGIDLKSFDYIFNNITKKLDLIVYSVTSKNNVLLKTLVEKFKCRNVERRFNTNILKDDDEYFGHHYSHAISAFYMSPFEEAVCLIIDGVGSNFSVFKNMYSGIMGTETTSIFEISNDYKKKTLYKKLHYAPSMMDEEQGVPTFFIGGGIDNQIDFDNISKKYPFKVELTTGLDIGNMYLAITGHLSFRDTESGKTMGLSAYGNKANDLPPFLFEDTTQSNNNLFSIDKKIIKHFYPELYDDLTFQKKADMAYEVQKALEKTFLYHAEFISKNSKIKNLVIGGGCALNILGISAIKEKYPEFNIFVDPIAHDGTHSIGAGLYKYKNTVLDGKLRKKNHFNSIYTGPKYEPQILNECIDNFLKDN